MTTCARERPAAIGPKAAWSRRALLRTDVLIVGAGQAGLAIGACLAGRGIDHRIVERGRVAERWRSAVWDSLRLLTPNWMNRLPGDPREVADPDGFIDRAALVAMLTAYAEGAPVLERAPVRRLTAQGRTFLAVTDRGAIAARAVVVATGACDRPALPGWAAALDPGLMQVAASGYRAPAQLPDGGVLVVGASATGVQLAREIHGSGRPVTLAVGRHTRLPRRYRGRDIMRWLDSAGVLDEPWDRAGDRSAARRQPSLQLSGKPDEADLDLGRVAAEGVRVVGRATGAAGSRIALAADLAASCAASELRRQRTLARIDAFATHAAPDAPPDAEAWVAPRHPESVATGLDLAAEGIRSVVWAIGYRRDYHWLRLPVLDRSGEIAHRGGVTAVPGLFALGLPFLMRRSSTFIAGAGRDAEAIAPVIAAHLDGMPAIAA